MTLPANKAFLAFRQARWGNLLPEDALLQADSSTWLPSAHHGISKTIEDIREHDRREFASWLFELRREEVVDGALNRRPEFPIYVRTAQSSELRALTDQASREAWDTWLFTLGDFLSPTMGYEWQALNGTGLEIDEAEFTAWIARYRRISEAHGIYRTHADTIATNLLLDLVRNDSLPLSKANEVLAVWNFVKLSNEAVRYDPMKVEHWTIPMIQAWILWRTPHAVMENSRAYRNLIGLDPICPFFDAPSTINQITEWAQSESAPLCRAFFARKGMRDELPKDEWTGLEFLSGLDDVTDKWGYRGQVEYEDITAPCKDIVRCWRPENESTNQSISERPGKATGLPGRPTSKTLFVAEFKRRAADGSFLPSLAQEAQYLAEWVGVSTLEQSRVTGINCPKFIKIGRAVRYRLTDLQEFVNSRERRSTSDAA